MHEEAEFVFASACKKTKRSFMKAREMLMGYTLNTRKVDLAVSKLGAAISESKNEELHLSPYTIIAFLKYFEDEKDVDGAKNFCEILKRLGNFYNYGGAQKLKENVEDGFYWLDKFRCWLTEKAD
ncbi:unnamed protein product [Malus baccata var. baccata]